MVLVCQYPTATTKAARISEAMMPTAFPLWEAENASARMPHTSRIIKS